MLSDIVIWIVAGVLLLSIAVVGLFALTEAPRPREDGLDEILRSACRRRDNCP